MFITNKYSKIYYTLISRAKYRQLDKSVYTEKHHILPKSLGGANDAENLAVLTAREHFICHRLLPRFTSGKSKSKMMYALWKLVHSAEAIKQNYKLTAHKYAQIKEAMKSCRTADDFTEEWKQKISIANKGKKSWNEGKEHTTESKKKMSESRRAKRGDPSWNIRPACKPETAAKIAEANLGRKWVHDGTGNRKYLPEAEALLLVASGWALGCGPRQKKNIIFPCLVLYTASGSLSVDLVLVLDVLPHPQREQRFLSEANDIELDSTRPARKIPILPSCA